MSAAREICDRCGLVPGPGADLWQWTWVPALGVEWGDMEHGEMVCPPCLEKPIVEDALKAPTDSMSVHDPSTDDRIE